MSDPETTVSPEEISEATHKMLVRLVNARNEFTFEQDKGTAKADVIIAMAKTIAAILTLRMSGRDLQKLSDHHGVDFLQIAQELADKVQLETTPIDRETFQQIGSSVPKAKA